MADTVVRPSPAANAVLRELLTLRGAIASMNRRLAHLEQQNTRLRTAIAATPTVRVDAVLRDDDPERVVLSRGQVAAHAYRLRQDGYTWAAIGRALGYGDHSTPDASACGMARYYARTNGLPWPAEIGGAHV